MAHLKSASLSTADQSNWYPNSGSYACGQERASLVWLNLEAVREALHVRTESASGRKFSFSTTLPGYGHTAASLLSLYNGTLTKSSLRILQYREMPIRVRALRWDRALIESLRLPVDRPWRPGV